MKWFQVYVNDLSNRVLSGADDAVVGAWFRILANCYRLENGGCYEQCRQYSMRQWMSIAGVDREALDKVVTAGLATWSGDDLGVHGYDIEQQRKATERKEKGREMANARWGHAASNAASNSEERRGEEKKGDPEVCAEPAADGPAATPPEPALLVFPCAGPVKEWNLTESICAELAEAYPGVVVLTVARKALEWCRSHPKKIKTAKGMRGWLGSTWCGREQDRSSLSPHRTTASEPVVQLPRAARPVVHEWKPTSNYKEAAERDESGSSAIGDLVDGLATAKGT